MTVTDEYEYDCAFFERVKDTDNKTENWYIYTKKDIHLYRNVEKDGKYLKIIGDDPQVVVNLGFIKNIQTVEIEILFGDDEKSKQNLINKILT